MQQATAFATTPEAKLCHRILGLHERLMEGGFFLEDDNLQQGPLHSAAGPIAAPEHRPGCTHCSSLSWNEEWHRTFSVRLCNDCKRSQRLISKVQPGRARPCVVHTTVCTLCKFRVHSVDTVLDTEWLLGGSVSLSQLPHRRPSPTPHTDGKDLHGKNLPNSSFLCTAARARAPSDQEFGRCLEDPESSFCCPSLQSTAKQRYHLTDVDLKPLGSLRKANPHRKDWQPMHLYLESQARPSRCLTCCCAPAALLVGARLISTRALLLRYAPPRLTFRTGSTWTISTLPWG